MVSELDTGQCVSEEADPRKGVDTRWCASKDAGSRRGVDWGVTSIGRRERVPARTLGREGDGL